MKPRIYLDYNASTPLDPRIAREMAEKMNVFGNPSSVHAEGRESRALVDEARVHVGRLLNCNHRQILFTSGGTEANNLAIMGTARANQDRGKHIITSAIEHSSVKNVCGELAREGYEITYVHPRSNGVIDSNDVAVAMREDTILITIMLANNEIGTIQPVQQICSLARARGIPVHTDAVQAVGKIPVDVEALGCDLLSISAHKIYGPKGVGALYFSESISLTPQIRGGSHEKGLRAGTENVAGIHALGFAAKILVEEGLPELLPLRQRLEAGLARTSMKILCEDAPRLPNTVNFYAPNWPGESLVMAFDLEGIAVSNGSACSAGVIEPSHVISALGYNDVIARSVIRVSLGKFTKPEEIDVLLRVIQGLEGGGVGL
ncbi:cysteine desulfurase [bacterium]|nr:cysteine desulfurase [bacterium]MCI0604035.1 cysteine desulfurase [bacterium]